MANYFEMVGIYTAALMTDVIQLHSGGNGSDKEFIDESMRQVDLSLAVDMTHQLPISLVLPARLPQPARSHLSLFA